MPRHPALTPLLARVPEGGRLFPGLTAHRVTKRIAVLRSQLVLTRSGLVIHASRKWFLTQSERAGVPEHRTASIPATSPPGQRTG